MPYLLVDDDPADLELLRLALDAAAPGAEVIAQGDSKAAFDWLRQELPDVELANLMVITDLNMPSMTGDELVRQIRQRWSSGPIVIVLSTSDRQEDVDRAYAVGANAYHAKPMGYHGTVDLCRSIVTYWGSTDRPQVKRRNDDGAQRLN